jgi:hypothetical protein
MIAGHRDAMAAEAVDRGGGFVDRAGQRASPSRCERPVT